MAIRVLVLGAVVLTQVSVGLAQDTITQRQSGIGASQVSDANFAITAIMPAVENKPYRAEKSAKSVQKLADGTVITVETHGLLARSSTGQVREDIHSNISGQVSGRMLDKNTTMATVADPSAHTITMWQTSEEKSAPKMAFVMHLPGMPKLAGKSGLLPAIAVGPPPPPPPGIAVKLDKAPKKDTDLVTTEDLGQQSIEGLLVSGKRTTTTIPLGEIGNDRPIVVTHEVWTSQELGIVVKQVDVDPRTGERTMELTNVSKEEPSPALFAPPEGYKVQDMADMMKMLGDIGKNQQK